MLPRELANELITYAHDAKKAYPDKEITVTLVTNFTLYKPEWDNILEKIDNLCISIDGKESTHNKNR